MTPSLQIIVGDSIEQMKLLPAESVNCIVTSPPYWGLRDYGHPGQVGMEPTYQAYVATMNAIFEEGRRVLRDDGTLWLNLGDSYASGGRGGTPGSTSTLEGGQANQLASMVKRDGNRTRLANGRGDSPAIQRNKTPAPQSRPPACLKPKDLIGIPWRVAFALQEAGWYLRMDNIWAKDNCMPESVNDRPTRSHEYFFLFSKSERYWYDNEAIKEPCSSGPADIKKMMEGKDRLDAKHFHDDPGDLAAANPRSNIGKKRGVGGTPKQDGHGRRHAGFNDRRDETEANGTVSLYRNKRSVWNVSTQPYSGAHFATFPPDLIKPCILAGCPVGGTVLDPFLGSGTTAMVALELGRNAIGIELNPEYAELARQRCDVTPGLPI